MRCAVFASGGGSNFQSLINRKLSQELSVEFALLICNNSGAGAMQRARSHSIPAVHLAPSHFATEQEYTEKLAALLSDHKVDFIVLAGYMKKIPPAIIAAYRNRIVNIHPGLLPAFGGPGMYGSRVHEAVLAYGAKISGITVHLVDEEYDHGPIILQQAIPVLDNDTPQTLAARVLELEHAHFWRAVQALATRSIRIDGKRVIGNV